MFVYLNANNVSMKLHTPYPYALLKHGLPQSYPSLARDIETDVAVMGAGITGALVSWYLSQAGVPCVVVDKRHVATGSTAASTSLIQYEIDTPLCALAKRIGIAAAVKSYHLCREAIYELERLSAEEALHCCFERRSSLQYASYKKHVADLQEEYKARKEAGFSLSLLNAADLRDSFGLAKPAALYTDEAAQLDAYLLTYKLLQHVQGSGSAVYDHTAIEHIEYRRSGVVLHTGEGCRIKARRLVIACGYESQRYVPQPVETLYTTYALISESVPHGQSWPEKALIWETAHPYLYMRTTDEHRILVGGKDTLYNQRTGFDLLPRKTAALKSTFEKLFPHLKLKIDFAWAGVFGSTKDGLPYIGSIPERPHTYFALGYGGNGITFSVLAAQIIRDAIKGRKNENSSLFSFSR